MKDALGERIKEFYENRTRHYITRRTHTILRIDGKAFHTYTKSCKKPFDDQLMDDMDATAKYLCNKIQGAKFGFVQSDEISILLTDFDSINTSTWFDGNIQKMSSISASMATNKFNALRIRNVVNYQFNNYGHTEETCNSIVGYLKNYIGAEFDSRVFSIPTKTEVENYFIWRQQDTTRNSIQSVAQSLYSQKQLHGKNTDQLQEMIFQKGINWNDYAPKYKRGRLIVKETYIKEILKNDPELKDSNCIRTRWISKDVPIFTQEREFLQNLIPDNK